jgi:hypothetical protein
MDSTDLLEIVRTDPFDLPCRACAALTANVWAYTSAGGARLTYMEYHACNWDCAEAIALESASARAPERPRGRLIPV